MVKPKIALFQHHPEASRHCVDGMINALGDNYRIRVFNEDECELPTFRNIDIIAFPGGHGDSNAYNKLLKPHMDAVTEFVDKGGRYLGICMGAYWATHHYFNILNGIKVVQYIKRRRSEIKRSFPTIAPVFWQNTFHNMYFYDGPTFVAEKQNYKTFATYMSGEPMAIMQKRIGLIGCHPESMRSWFTKKYMQQHWHYGEHHELLLEFVNELIER
jgi:GMP synthase-like glutamine amidotransferase